MDTFECHQYKYKVTVIDADNAIQIVTCIATTAEHIQILKRCRRPSVTLNYFWLLIKD